MAEEFFDPIQRDALIAHFRGQLNILQTQIKLLEEVARQNGVTIHNMTETHRLAAKLESKIFQLESRYATVH